MARRPTNADRSTRSPKGPRPICCLKKHYTAPVLIREPSTTLPVADVSRQQSRANRGWPQTYEANEVEPVVAFGGTTQLEGLPRFETNFGSSADHQYVRHKT